LYISLDMPPLLDTKPTEPGRCSLQAMMLSMVPAVSPILKAPAWGQQGSGGRGGAARSAGLMGSAHAVGRLQGSRAADCRAACRLQTAGLHAGCRAAGLQGCRLQGCRARGAQFKRWNPLMCLAAHVSGTARRGRQQAPPPPPAWRVPAAAPLQAWPAPAASGNGGPLRTAPSCAASPGRSARHTLAATPAASRRSQPAQPPSASARRPHLHAAHCGGPEQHLVVGARIGDHGLGVALGHALCDDRHHADGHLRGDGRGEQQRGERRAQARVAGSCPAGRAAQALARQWLPRQWHLSALAPQRLPPAHLLERLHRGVEGAAWRQQQQQQQQAR
jgi:hypothetical protein